MTDKQMSFSFSRLHVLFSRRSPVSRLTCQECVRIFLRRGWGGVREMGSVPHHAWFIYASRLLTSYRWKVPSRHTTDDVPHVVHPCLRKSSGQKVATKNFQNRSQLRYRGQTNKSNNLLYNSPTCCAASGQLIVQHVCVVEFDHKNTLC
jgi:hypothetical protein